SFISPCCCGYTTVFTGKLVFNRVGLVVEIIHRSYEHVVGNVIEVASVLQPWTSHGNMVGSTFSFCFDEQLHTFQVGTFPWCKWLKQLQPVRVRIHDYFHFASVFGRSLISGVFYRESFWRKFNTCRFVEHYFFTVVVYQFIGKRVESKVTCDSESCYNFRRCYESMGGSQAVIPFGEVPVEGSDDGVFPVWIINMPCPFPDTRPAGICQYQPANFHEDVQKTVFFNSVTHLLTTGGNRKFSTGSQLLLNSLFSQRS